MGENSAVITGTCLDCGKVTDEPMTCSDGSVFCFDCYDKRWPLDLPGHLVHAVHRVSSDGNRLLKTVSARELLENAGPSCYGKRLGRRPTWMELRRLEPRLFALLKEAKGTDGSGEHFCANAVWYGYSGYPGIKERLCLLVGWYREGPEHPILSTAEAYDVAYERIYDALPDCRDCACL